MRINKLLVLSALSLTVIGSSILTSSHEVEAKKLSKYEKKIYNNAFTLKNTDASVNSLIKKFKSGKAFNIKFKSRKTANKALDKFTEKTKINIKYLDICNNEYQNTFTVGWELWEEYYCGGHIKKHHIIYVDKKLCKGIKKAIAKNEKEVADNKAFTQNTLIPAVYDKYWKLLEQGKSVKPIFFGNNGYDNLNISKYPAIQRCCNQNGTRPEFHQLSEVSQVHILTYFLRRYEYTSGSDSKFKEVNSFCKWKTDIERLNCYFDTVANDKNFNLNCQTIYEYNELLIRQLGLFSEFRKTYEGLGHGWGTLTCKDFNGDNRFMECNNSGFYITGAENNWRIDDETGESTHNQEDMFAYLNSELEYLGY